MKLHKRLICALTGLACVALLASCTPHNDGDTHSVTIAEAGNTSDLVSPPIQTDTGWEVTFPETTIAARIECARTNGTATYFKTYNLKPEETSSATPLPGTTLVSLNPQDGSVRWVRKITPRMHTHYFYDKSNTPQGSFLKFQECTGTALVSNEKYLAFYLWPWMASEGSSNISDQRMNIVVLNAATGNEVRTIEVSGLVLGQAIVNDSLVVETAQNYYPAGTGVLNVFSLTDPHAEPATTRTDNWLIGSTNDSLLMSPQSSGKYSGFRGRGPYWISTITRTTISGEELETFTGVTAIHPNGWIERAQDPKAAVTEAAANPANALLTTLPRDLINIDSGTSLDITGQYVADVSLPTGPALLLQTVTTTGEGKKEKTTFINHSWLPATPDATEPRTNDIQQISLENKASKVFSKTIHMGEEDK
jgi:hypothetical protein avisC_03246